MVIESIETSIIKAHSCVCIVQGVAYVNVTIEVTSWSIYGYYLYFVDEEAKAEKALVTCPKPRSSACGPLSLKLEAHVTKRSSHPQNMRPLRSVLPGPPGCCYSSSCEGMISLSLIHITTNCRVDFLFYFLMVIVQKTA